MKRSIDKVIEYFKNELELLNDDYNSSQEERKFIFRIGLAIFSATVVIASAAISFLLKPEVILVMPDALTFVQLIILILLLSILLSSFIYIIRDHSVHKKYFANKVKLDLVINFLLNLKIQGKEDYNTLKPLREQIELGFRKRGRVILPYVKGYENTAMDYVLAVDKINNRILDNEEKNKAN